MIQHTVNSVEQGVSVHCLSGTFYFVAEQNVMARVMLAVITNNFDILCGDQWKSQKF